MLRIIFQFYLQEGDLPGHGSENELFITYYQYIEALFI